MNSRAGSRGANIRFGSALLLFLAGPTTWTKWIGWWNSPPAWETSSAWTFCRSIKWADSNGKSLGWIIRCARRGRLPVKPATRSFPSSRGPDERQFEKRCRGKRTKVPGAAIGAWLLVPVYYFYQYALRSAPSVMMPQLTEAFEV